MRTLVLMSRKAIKPLPHEDLKGSGEEQERGTGVLSVLSRKSSMFLYWRPLCLPPLGVSSYRNKSMTMVTCHMSVLTDYASKASIYSH